MAHFPSASKLVTLGVFLLGSFANFSADGATVSYTENFDSGLPTAGWEYYSSSATYGRIQAIGGRMRMDVSVDSNNSLNEAVYTVDLEGATSAELSFQQIDTADEETSLPATFTDHYNGDGVAISADGTVWYTIVNATELNTSSLTTFSIDLLAEREAIRAAYDATFDFTSNFKIKFQQYDNFTSPADGREWDAISIIADVGPPTLSISAQTECLEGDSNIAATLSVSPTPSSDLIVTLTGDPDLSFPATVTIPAGQTSVDFSFSAIDDALQQGSRNVSISATATGLTSAEQIVTIHDDESPLTVTFELDGKGTIDSGDLVQTVLWGNPAIEPVIFANSGWHFDGWDSDFSFVESDLTITAQYLPVHAVTFNLGAYGTRTGGVS